MPQPAHQNQALFSEKAYSVNQQKILLNSSRWFNHISIGFIVFGILARVVQYASNHSLWYDEVKLVLNLQERSYFELLGRLSGNQAAPPLFLWIEKFSMQVLGNNEYALRLFPLAAGIASLFLFYRLVCRFAVGITVPIAIALFACLRYTVAYSAEVKPYGIDLAVAIALFLILHTYQNNILSWRQKLYLSLLGSFSIWLSYPSIFILGGVELFGLCTKSWRHFVRLWMNRLPLYGVWLISFLALYRINIQPTLEAEVLVYLWSYQYPDSESGLDILWGLDAIGRFFHRPMGFSSNWDGVAIAAFMAGLIRLYRHDKRTLLGLQLPLIVTLFAAYLNHYPFRGRLVLFLIPFVILVVAEGIAVSLRHLQPPHRYLKIPIAILFVSLVALPTLRMGHRVIRPELFYFEHSRPVIQHIQAEWQPGDGLLVFHDARRQFLYYGPKFGFQPEDAVFSQHSASKDPMTPENINAFAQELTQLDGKDRIWVLVLRTEALPDELAAELNRHGQLLSVYVEPNASGYLYDVRNHSSQSLPAPAI